MISTVTRQIFSVFFTKCGIETMAPSEEELSALTLSDLADAIRNGEISAAEAMAATLARIERLDPHLNAFIWRDGERAMARAKEADAARGRGNGPGNNSGCGWHHRIEER